MVRVRDLKFFSSILVAVQFNTATLVKRLSFHFKVKQVMTNLNFVMFFMRTELFSVRN